MDVEEVRRICLGFPHCTEHVQWDNDLVFKVAGKMFAVAALDPGGHWLSFKCSPEDFAELTERANIIPAPYMARALWVSLQTRNALPRAEITQRLRDSYDLVYAKLSKKTKALLGE
jgi:predicted DNA-binding protein (MmcQ/YjbR family)